MRLALNRWLQTPTLRYWIIPTALTLLALGLGVVQLDNMGLFGDEYNSLLEFTAPGYHPHSVPFFVLLRGWRALGTDSIEWLRLLSALFAAALVPIIYALGWEITGDWRGGGGAAVLATFSAWRVEEGQEIRFYTYFMLMAALLLLGLLRARRTRHWLDILLVSVGAVLTATAHLLGSLFVLAALGFGLPWARLRNRWLVLGALGLGVVALTLLPSLIPADLSRAAYTTLAPLQGPARGDYPGPRGASAGTLLKPFYAGYIYLVGTSLYPLDIWVSLAAVGITVAACLLGLWALRHQREVVVLLVAWGVVPMGLLFWALDSLAPAEFVSPGAHHVAPAVFVFWLAAGALALHPQRRWLWGLACLASLVGLGYYYWGDWSLNGRKDVDMHATMLQAQAAGCAPGAQLLVDGRMRVPAVVYFGRSCLIRQAHALLEVAPTLTTTQVGFVYQTITSDTPQVIPVVQAELARQNYIIQQRWAYGLAVVETYRQAASPILADGQLALPWSVPPLGFNSLRLPLTSTVLPHTAIMGAVIMRPTAQTTWTVTLPTAQKYSGLTLTSSTFQATSAAVGTVMVELTNGEVLTLPVTLNQHTADWAAAGCEQCTVALSWRKQLDKLGRSAYPGAWADFMAQGFAYTWQWPQPATVRAVHFALAPAQAGQWWVWQVVPRP